jgi:hypothetical protein
MPSEGEVEQHKVETPILRLHMVTAVVVVVVDEWGSRKTCTDARQLIIEIVKKSIEPLVTNGKADPKRYPSVEVLHLVITATAKRAQKDKINFHSASSSSAGLASACIHFFNDPAWLNGLSTSLLGFPCCWCLSSYFLFPSSAFLRA